MSYYSSPLNLIIRLRSLKSFLFEFTSSVIVPVIAAIIPLLKLWVTLIAVIAIAAPVPVAAVFIGSETFYIRGVSKFQLSLSYTA